MSRYTRQTLQASDTKHHDLETPRSAPAALSCDYNSISRSPHHKWTMEQKITLFILQQFYEISWDNTKILFNAIFADELLSSRGLSRAALFSMHYQLQKDGFQVSGRWTALRNAIESKAFKLDLQLPIKHPTEPMHAVSATKTSKPHQLEHKSPRLTISSTPAIADSPSLSDSDDTLLGDEISSHQSPTQLRGSVFTKGSLELPGLMTPSCSNELSDGESGQTNTPMPRIVFRA